MQLRGIRRLHLTINALLMTGLLAVFGAVAGGVFLESETLFGVFFAFGWIAIGACLLLSFAVDRVRCPNCGRQFNRPDYRNWFVRNFAKTQTHRSCVHCDYGRAIQNNAETPEAGRDR